MYQFLNKTLPFLPLYFYQSEEYLKNAKFQLKHMDFK